jgi:hypothetical protein
MLLWQWLIEEAATKKIDREENAARQWIHVHLPHLAPTLRSHRGRKVGIVELCDWAKEWREWRENFSALVWLAKVSHFDFCSCRKSFCNSELRNVYVEPPILHRPKPVDSRCQRAFFVDRTSSCGGSLALSHCICRPIDMALSGDNTQCG